MMKNPARFFVVAVCLALVTGCQTYVPSNAVRTIGYNSRLKSDAVLEAAVDAARESKLPSVSKLDKANGVVEFGGFGLPEMGLAAQARIRSDNQVEITVKRGSIFVPVKADSDADIFESRLKDRLAELERKAQ